MPATLRHFAINADDVDRARHFYQEVMGWQFDPWGPPDFYQIHNAGDDVIGALQSRRSLGQRSMPGIEMTVGVESLAETIQAVEANGGRLLNQPFRIDGVGELVFFEDSEGNALAAMQYEPGYFQ